MVFTGPVTFSLQCYLTEELVTNLYLLEVIKVTYVAIAITLISVRPICQHNLGNNKMLKEPRIMLE